MLIGKSLFARDSNDSSPADRPRQPIHYQTVPKAIRLGLTAQAG